MSYTLVCCCKITYIASILSYKQWPWVYNLKSLSFTSPFFRFNVQPTEPHQHFISIVEIPLPQKIPTLWFSHEHQGQGSGFAPKQSTVRFQLQVSVRLGCPEESCADSNNVDAVQHHKPCSGSPGKCEIIISFSYFLSPQSLYSAIQKKIPPCLSVSTASSPFHTQMSQGNSCIFLSPAC